MSDISYEIQCADECNQPYDLVTRLVNRTQYFRNQIHKPETIYVVDVNAKLHHEVLKLTEVMVYNPKDEWSTSNIHARGHPKTRYLRVTLSIDAKEFQVYEEEINLELGAPDWFYIPNHLITLTQEYLK